ncbi:MAG: hypothetical protein U0175_29270 [Caldilineaceae bacterium]
MQTRTLRNQQREALRQAEHLFQTLLARAFGDAGKGVDNGNFMARRRGGTEKCRSNKLIL